MDPWQEYRRKRKLAVFMFVSYIPLVALTAWLSDRLMHTSGPVIPVMFGWLGFGAIANYRCQTFLCPRCGKPFFSRFGKFGRSDQPRCVHCGLPKYAPPD